MSWPYTHAECPRCRYFDALDPPLRDDAGYEVVGLCQHPRIGTDLFRMRRRDPGHCPCFVPTREPVPIQRQPTAT